MRLVTIALLLALSAGTASAQSIVKAAVGAQGIFYDDTVKPSDFEIGASARASLSPHISAVGSGYYGFQHSYLRGSAGVRVTATNVEDPNFSIGLGMVYNFSSEPAIRPEEWSPDASLGWRPWPVEMPNVLLVANGAYGLDSNNAYVTVGVRYALDLWGAK